MKEDNLEALHANMNILITGLDLCHVFDSTVWNTGETGDIYYPQNYGQSLARFSNPRESNENCTCVFGSNNQIENNNFDLKETSFNLVKLSCLSFNFTVQVEHCPVALDEPPTSGNIDGVPGVPVPGVHKLLPGQVLGRFTVAFHNLEKIIKECFIWEFGESGDMYVTSFVFQVT